MGRKPKTAISSPTTPATEALVPAAQGGWPPATPMTSLSVIEIHEVFQQQFVIRGEDGQPSIDPDTGDPLYEPKYDEFFTIAFDGYISVTRAEVNARLAANRHTSDAARQRDEDLKIALAVIYRDIHPSDQIITKAELNAVINDSENEMLLRCSRMIRDKTRAILADLKSNATEASDVCKLPEGAKVIREFTTVVTNSITAMGEADADVSANMHRLQKQFRDSPAPENVQIRIDAFEAFLDSVDDTGETLLRRTVLRLVRDGWKS